MQTPAWQQMLMRAWTHRGALAWALWPLALVYGRLLALRRALYRWGVLIATRLPVPVLVVGNVVTGGAGKTPVVMALVQHLQQRGLRVGVISRGYGRSLPGCREVTPQRTAQEVGDEPMLIWQRTGAPVFVAEQRVQAAQALLKQHPQTQIIISDDGLQHLALQRDLELGVFDDRGVGNGWLLPAGPLREPWPRALDLVLHTGARPAFAGFRARRQLADYALRRDGQRVPLSHLAPCPTPDHAAQTTARPLLALAAIAQPGAFFDMLRGQGLTLARTLALPDHHDFNNWSAATHANDQVLCTEKDAVKLWPLQPDALAVPLLSVLPEAFWAALDARVDALTGPVPPIETLSSHHGHTTT